MLKTSSGVSGIQGGEARDLVRAVADVVSLLEPRLLRLWKETGMTLGQRRVLRQLREGPRSAGAVAEALDIAAPTLTRQLSKLESRGLIARTTDTADRRKVFVVLTSSGRRMLADHRVFSGSAVAEAARRLPAGERATLVAGLEALAGLARATDVEGQDD